MSRRAGLVGALVIAAGIGWGSTRPRGPLGAPEPSPVAVALPPVASVAPGLDPAIMAAESIYLRGQLDSAEALWSEALGRARAASDSVGQGRILTWLGLTEYRRADYRRARAVGEAALALKLRLRDSADLARSYNALGLVAWNEGRLEAAREDFGRASAAARAVRDEGAFAKAANNLALVHTELADFPAARVGFELTRDAGARIGDPRIEGGALANLGMLEVQLGDPRSAVAHLTRARALYRMVGFEIGEQNALGQLGTAYDALGEPGPAFAALDSALQLSRRQGLRQEEASNLELIAGLHRQAGDLRRALQLYRQAHRLNRELGLEVERGATLRSTAEVQLALGRADLARPDAETALAIHRATGAKREELRDLLLLADIAARDDEDDVAVERLGTAERLARALGARTARVEVTLARAALADRGGDAALVLRVLRAAEPDLARGGYASEWIASTLRGRAFARLGRLDSAVAAGREAIAAVERVRGSFGSGYFRSGYAADKTAAYDELIDALLRSGDTAGALEIADAARSGALREHLAASGFGTGAGATVRGLSEGEALLRRIDTLVSRMDAVEETPPAERDSATSRALRALAGDVADARGAYEALLVRVAERDAAGAGLLGGRRARAEEVRRALKEGETLLEYHVAAEQVIAFVVTDAGVQSVATAVPRPHLARRARLARELLGRRDGGPEAYELLTALHEVLVAPVERAGLLRGTRRLIVVPHSILVYLPFAALRSAATERHLVEDYPLLTLPSAAALPALRGAERRAAEPAGAFVVAPFPDALPGTRREARALGRTLRVAEKLEGKAATEQRLRRGLATGGVVHVASHGTMNPRNPMFSRIELARGGGEPTDDGRLEVHEVLGLRISAPLVFLSGCETGVGAAWATEFAQGEDYATLAQAFLYAGAGSVVATLWRVTDEGAAAFAERFYRRLESMEPMEALAEAQRDMLRDRRYGSPYHWAAYQVSGGIGNGHARATTPNGSDI
jgi:CHAT domain-containing protein/tetratricopeptide (TPR) repeat protein